MENNIHIVCPHCTAVNRLPEDKLGSQPKCGKCSRNLFGGHPVELTESTFQKHIERNDVAVVVDFWAAWCGPCKMMAPAFEKAAAQMEPGVRFAKLDTERRMVDWQVDSESRVSPPSSFSRGEGNWPVSPGPWI